MLGQWNLLETVNLARATYQHVWARNAEGGGGGGGGAEQKISVEADMYMSKAECMEKWYAYWYVRHVYV